jgi:hypothetical protein
MRKAQERMRTARPYSEKIRGLAAHLAVANVTEYRHPFLTKMVEDQKPTRVGVIVVTTDKGLCGGLNTNVLRMTLNAMRQWEAEGATAISATCIGNKGLGFMQRLGAKVVSHIATDNYSGGKLAGEAMVEALKGKGKVAIIDHPEIESVMLRTKGFREVLAKHKGMSIVSSVPGGALRDTSYKATQDVLEKHPDLDGLFCINDPTALGALAAMEKAGRTGRIKVISFDGQPEAKEAVRSGKIYAEPVQFPDRIGAKTIQTIAAYFAGKRVYGEELIPTELYRKADADKDPSLKKP